MQPAPTSHSRDAAIAILRRHEASVTAYFQHLLARQTEAPARLIEAISYTILAGGKRLRPALVLECFHACSNDDLSSAAPAIASAHHASAVAAAAAMELIHNFSLVHDDLPAMDDDDLRRGRPTNHKVYGEAMAILAGDAMVSLAFEVLADDVEPRLLGRLIHELAHATGPVGMIGGQALDIDPGYHPTQLPELQRLHRMKTGALLVASCRMGAIAAGADDTTIEAIDSFGRHLGLAFQIVDDILDVTSTPEQLGKATHKDEAKGKVTYPMLIGIDESRRQADEHLAAAVAAVSGFGSSAEGLRTLALFVGQRNI
jgi:geranylgeranyl diphosphate synthase type II